jgi:flagellar hook-basal body complex protein FliE
VNVQLKPFNFEQALARAGLRADGTRVEGGGQAGRAAGAATAAPGTGFQVAMSQALAKVSAEQLQAQRLQREVTLDNPTVSLEQTMLAMQKAQIGFQATLAVRNRLVQAYSEIMNMNV